MNAFSCQFSWCLRRSGARLCLLMLERRIQRCIGDSIRKVWQQNLFRSWWNQRGAENMIEGVVSRSSFQVVFCDVFPDVGGLSSSSGYVY